MKRFSIAFISLFFILCSTTTSRAEDSKEQEASIQLIARFLTTNESRADIREALVSVLKGTPLEPSAPGIRLFENTSNLLPKHENYLSNLFSKNAQTILSDVVVGNPLYQPI